VLAALGLAERTQSFLAWSLERIRKQGLDEIREQLAVFQDEDLPLDPALVANLDDQQAEALLLHALRTIGVNLRFGTRPPEAIVGRLVRKLRREDPRGQIERALTLLERLCHIQGPLAEALSAVRALLTEYDLPADEIDELQVIFALTRAHGLPEQQIELDFGLGRGLNYYTGIIFEIYDSNDLQVCGGGRYDDLVTALGGRQSAPAIGFAYGLERVVAAAHLPPPPLHTHEVLVAAMSEDDYAAALHVAQRLRATGWTVLVDVRGRNPAGNARDADRRHMQAMVLIGPEERTSNSVLWRDIRDRSERRIDLNELPLPAQADELLETHHE
jgi:histidyl-tRNA synthetase